jgi:Zn-dependent metalloprotease
MKSTIIMVLFTLSCTLLAEQVKAQSADEFWNSRMQQIAKSNSKPGWIWLREEINPQPSELYSIYPEAFGLTKEDEMRVRKVEKDKLGYEHFRYQQYYKGVRIVGAENIVHHNGTFTYLVNGKFAFIRNLEVTPSIDAEKALSRAIASVNATSYLWQNEAAIKNLRQMNHNPALSFDPEAELVICMRDWSKSNFDESNLVLAYKFDLNVLPLTESKTVFVDATTGDIIFQLPLTLSCSSGTGNTTWHGTQNIKTSDDEDFYLDYDCGDRPVIGSRTGNPAIPYEYFDLDNNWISGYSSSNDQNDLVGVTTYFYLFQAYDYYDEVQGRKSWDDDEADVNAFSENKGDEWTGYDEDNALWHGGSNVMFFGAGTTGDNTTIVDDYNALDVVAHEFTHGVTQTSAGLFYNSESGALNESFSDIFGEVIEYWFENPVEGPSWNLGDDVSGFNFRVMSDPNSGGGGDPDTYEGTNWYDLDGCFPVGSNDYCGVHTNSGVQNFWFYLLSEGGSGVNDQGEAYIVEGIGIEKAADIAYRSLTEYLGTTSGFTDAREGSIQAAYDLFGSCSDEIIAVAKAWYAVGVGDDDVGDHVITCSDYWVR